MRSADTVGAAGAAGAAGAVGAVGAAAGAAGGALWGPDGSLHPGATAELAGLMRSLGCLALLTDASRRRLAETSTLRRLERCAPACREMHMRCT